MFLPSPLSVGAIAEKALVFEEVAAKEDFDSVWQTLFEGSLDKSTFDFESGPLWRLKVLTQGKGADRSALVFSFVHSLDDQKSGNILLHDILRHMQAAEEGKPLADPEPLSPAQSIEAVMVGEAFEEEFDWQRLLNYALEQAGSGGKPIVTVPSALRSDELSCVSIGL